ncbi:MAG: hypothetical protein JJ974_05265 [Phycisphaerales bacterium]|nr:hypothetical protein [Phycisphaerales bacterium]
MTQDQSNDQAGQNDADFQLSDADQAAVDAYFEDGHSEIQDADDRSMLVQRLMRLLDTPIPDDGQRDVRIDVADLRAQNSHETQLTASSASSVDDWMEGQKTITQRDSVHAELAGMVITGAEYSQQERDSLVNRTMAMLQDDIDQTEKRYIMDLPISPGGRFRLADLVSLAATLLLVASVAIPVMNGVRDRSMRAICLDNMATTGQAFGNYAGSNRDALPMATAGFGSSGGSTWMDVGTTPDRSNSSNLFVLIRTNHATLEDLACPTNPDALVSVDPTDKQDWRSLDEISYSYRIMPYGGIRVHDADHPVRMVVLADRSPVIRRIVAGQKVRPEENTPNHNGTGQHVLGLDGSSVWHRDPVLDQGDNLWLPRSVERALYDARDRAGIIQGNELPSGPNDAFVAP